MEGVRGDALAAMDSYVRTQPAVQSAEVEDEEVQVLELMESEVLPRALLVV